MFLPAPTGNFKPCPVGTHLAMCYRLIDLGTQATSYKGTPKIQHKILISWEIPNERTDDDRPFSISNRYTWSMSDRSALRRDLEAWRGRKFQDSDFGEGGFDVRNILGKPCLLSITHEEREGRIYERVSSVSNIMKGMEVPSKTENDLVYLWLHRDHFDQRVFDELSDSLKETIRKAPEYQQMFQSNGAASNYREDLEDDIPF
jgi:hypothetical protein